MDEITIMLSVRPKDQQQAVRGAEALSRAATGLALDGIEVSMNFFQKDEDE